MDKNHNSGKRE